MPAPCRRVVRVVLQVMRLSSRQPTSLDRAEQRRVSTATMVHNGCTVRSLKPAVPAGPAGRATWMLIDNERRSSIFLMSSKENQWSEETSDGDGTCTVPRPTNHSTAAVWREDRCSICTCALLPCVLFSMPDLRVTRVTSHCTHGKVSCSTNEPWPFRTCHVYAPSKQGSSQRLWPF